MSITARSQHHGFIAHIYSWNFGTSKENLELGMYGTSCDVIMNTVCIEINCDERNVYLGWTPKSWIIIKP